MSANSYPEDDITLSFNKHLNLNSFLNDKDIAMTSMELDDDIYETSSISSFDCDSPRCERFNNNVYIISSRSKDGTQPSDTFINEAMSFPLIVNAN
jgi:hypothetical protein